MKNRLNNTLQEVELLMKGKVSSLRFYNVHYEEDLLDDERVLDAVNYLDGKGIFYTLKDVKNEKYGDGLELKLVDDKEEIDCLYEDLDCRMTLDTINRDENRFFNKLDRMNIDTFHYFMTKEQIENIRFDIVKYAVGDNFNFDVFYSEGLVVIHK